MSSFTAGTYSAKLGELKKAWHVIDATDLVLGRLAAEVAKILRGKHKPEFTPHMDSGDHVVVVNAEKLHVTGKKLEQDKCQSTKTGALQRSAERCTTLAR